MPSCRLSCAAASKIKTLCACGKGWYGWAKVKGSRQEERGEAQWLVRVAGRPLSRRGEFSLMLRQNLCLIQPVHQPWILCTFEWKIALSESYFLKTFHIQIKCSVSWTLVQKHICSSINAGLIKRFCKSYNCYMIYLLFVLQYTKSLVQTDIPWILPSTLRKWVQSTFCWGPLISA